MKNKKFLFLLLIFCFFKNIVAQEFNQFDLKKLFANKKEIEFSFSISDKRELKNITKIISIDKILGNTVVAYANEIELDKFLLLKYPITIIEDRAKSSDAFNMASSIAEMSLWDKYPTYPLYEEMMAQLQAKHPDICDIDTLTVLPGGRKILIAKISDNIHEAENEPQFLYLSTIHGNETTGFVLMLRLIDYLLSNYNTNTRVSNIINNTEIWICPNSNPDGTYALGNHIISNSASTMGNSNGINLNRNFPDPQQGPHPDGFAWQPETQAFMAFAASKNFVMGANLHGGAEVLNYPWDTWPQLTADDVWWNYVCRNYADSVQLAGKVVNYFKDVSATGVINGYQWYTINGSRMDYMNYFLNCREVTIEISGDKVLSTDLLPSRWDWNSNAFLKLIEESHFGIRGIVKDSCSGLPLRAKITIKEHDFDNSEIYSGLPVGNYHRLIQEGTYNVTYSAEGYQSKTIGNVDVVNGKATLIDIELSKLKPEAVFTFSAKQATVEFTNTSVNAEYFQWYYDDVFFSDEKNPVFTFSEEGTYQIKLMAYNSCYKDSVIIPVQIIKSGINTFEKNAEPLIALPKENGVWLQLSYIPNSPKRISVYNSCGKLVYQDNNNSSNMFLSSDSRFIKLRPGFYLLIIDYKFKKYIQKIAVTG